MVHRNVEHVLAALAAAGAEPSHLARLRLLPDTATTTMSAAAALEVWPVRIANSLVFDADGHPVLVITSAAYRVDTWKVAELVGASVVQLASTEFAVRATGQEIGGIAPVGHPAPLPTFVDWALAGYEEVWAAGGTAHAAFPTTFRELLAVTGGRASDVASPR